MTEEAIFNVYGTVISMDETLDQWKERLEGVFPTRSNVENTKLEDKLFDAKRYIQQRIRLHVQRYLFRYSLVQTVNMIPVKRLNLPEQM